MDGSGTVRVYGPRLRTQKDTNNQLLITGGPFVENATVHMYQGPPENGMIVGSATTDASGNLPEPGDALPVLSINFSAVPTGTELWLADDQSSYPVLVTVPP